VAFRNRSQKTNSFGFDAVYEKKHHPKNEVLSFVWFWLPSTCTSCLFLPITDSYLFSFFYFSFFCLNAAKSGSLNKELWIWSNKEEKKKREQSERKRESCLDSHASSQINEGEAKESCA